MEFITHGTLLWWQISLLKLACVAFGILIGAYWPMFFRRYTLPLIILVVVLSIYLGYAWFASV
jgi:hypothetical protein